MKSLGVLLFSSMLRHNNASLLRAGLNRGNVTTMRSDALGIRNVRDNVNVFSPSDILFHKGHRWPVEGVLAKCTRSYSTASSAAGVAEQEDYGDLRGDDKSVILKAALAGTSPKIREDPSLQVSDKVVQMELKWLNDPRALADRVERALKSGHIALAAELTRAAQKENINSSVAWNHILSHSMVRGQTLAAFKFYNDVS